jgi:hypothetical protein
MEAARRHPEGVPSVEPPLLLQPAITQPASSAAAAQIRTAKRLRPNRAIMVLPSWVRVTGQDGRQYPWMYGPGVIAVRSHAQMVPRFPGGATRAPLYLSKPVLFICNSAQTRSEDYFLAATTPSGTSKLPVKTAVGEPPAG